MNLKHILIEIIFIIGIANISRAQCPVFNSGDVAPDVVNNVLTSDDVTKVSLQFMQMGLYSQQSRGRWTFFTKGEKRNNLLSPSSGVISPTINVVIGDNQYDFYGMVVGDFNHSFIPKQLKQN